MPLVLQQSKPNHLSNRREEESVEQKLVGKFHPMVVEIFQSGAMTHNVSIPRNSLMLFLSYNVSGLRFGVLVEQNKQFQEVTWGSPANDFGGPS